MMSPGLYVDLSPWGYHLLRFSAAAAAGKGTAASAD
jgi:hypothetical protein